MTTHESAAAAVSGENQRETEDSSQKAPQCPECGGPIASDETQADRACEECGLVIEADQIDRGPEWRAFSSEERDRQSRVGAPVTKTLHDKGLTTEISWQDKDAYGQQLGPRQREKMERLRTWNERFQTQDHQEQNLRQALGEIDRMASALGLPQDVQETASVIYRRALNEGLLPGRSIEGIATATVYAGARVMDNPRSTEEVARVSRVGEKRFTRAYRYIVRQLDLAIGPADPKEFLPRFLSDLVDDPETGIFNSNKHEVENKCRELIDVARDENIHSGKSPTSLASGAIYAACLLTSTDITQRAIADVADTTPVTIRNRYQEMLEAYSESS